MMVGAKSLAPFLPSDTLQVRHEDTEGGLVFALESMRHMLQHNKLLPAEKVDKYVDEKVFPWWARRSPRLADTKLS